MLDPHQEAKATFWAHWEAVTVTRSNQTFAGADPNHDHVVRIRQPEKAGAKRTAKKPAKPKTPRVVVPVIMGGRA